MTVAGGALDALSRVRDAWHRFWFAPVSTSSLAVVRIAFGLVMLFWTITLGHDLFAFFTADGIVPTPPDYGETGDTGAWGLLNTFPSDAAVVAMYVALLFASLCLLVGFQTRVAAVLVFLGLLAFQRRNPWVFNSGDGLLRVISFYLMLAPAGAALSLDRWRRAKDRFWEFPLRAPWALRLIQIQMSVLYLAAVWHKVRGTTWNDGTAVSYAFRVAPIERFPVPDAIVNSLLIANLLTFGTLAIELSLGILVWNRVLRPWVLLLGVGLHLGIDYAVRVGFFSYAVFVLYLAFVPPETMNAWLLALRGRLARVRARGQKPVPAAVASPAVHETHARDRY